jgi:hypothetical protein
MSNFTCPDCGVDIIDSASGYITGCQHFPKEDLGTMSGKVLSDNPELSNLEADHLAFKLLKEEKNVCI